MRQILEMKKSTAKRKGLMPGEVPWLRDNEKRN